MFVFGLMCENRTVMTKVSLTAPTPAAARYTISDIHQLVCQRRAEWAKIPEIALRLQHSSESSAVTAVAWRFYVGNESPEEIARQYDKSGGVYYRITADSLRALGKVLGIAPVRGAP
jgi:hypothetical protein